MKAFSLWKHAVVLINSKSRMRQGMCCHMLEQEAFCGFVGWQHKL